MKRQALLLLGALAAAIVGAAMLGTVHAQDQTDYGTVSVATFFQTDSSLPPPNGGRELAYAPLGVRVGAVAVDGSGRRESGRTARDGFGFLSLPAGRYELRPRSSRRTRRASLEPPRARIVQVKAGKEADVILIYRRKSLPPPNHQTPIPHDYEP